MAFKLDKFFKSLPGDMDIEELKSLAPAEMWEESPQEAAILAMRRSGKFDANGYLNCYEDVKKVKADPVRHFVLHGLEEKRKFNKPSRLSEGMEVNQYDAKTLYEENKILLEYIGFLERELEKYHRK